MNAQDMKNSILQLAIQGKLVEQRKEEGTAKELLEQIKVEKEQLIKQKKIKKETPLPAITEDEIPFEIPENWEWVRLVNIVSILGDGIHGTPNYDEMGEYYFINGNNLTDGNIEIKDSTKRVNFDEYMKYKKELNSNTVLVSINGTIGNVAFYNNEKVIFGKSACYFNLLSEELKFHLYWILKTKYFLDYAVKNATGSTIKNVSLATMKNFVVPLPPIEEQKRIVAKIEELMPYVEKYGEAHFKLEMFNKKFPADMQKSILQYAIQGKLVEQREEEGTAEELYHQIQEEKAKLIKKGKIKKEKPLTEITEDQLSSDIPGNWKWVRLGNMINLLSGQDFPPEKYNDTNNGMPYITGASSLSNNGVIVNRWTEEPRCIAEVGDVLLVCKGSGYGKTVICDVEKAHIARQLMSIKYSEYMNMMYIKYFLSANFAIIKKMGQGVIPGIDRNSVQNMLLPLPPLKEQKRIVEKIEELLPYTKQLVK